MIDQTEPNLYDSVQFLVLFNSSLKIKKIDYLKKYFNIR